MFYRAWHGFNPKTLRALFSGVWMAMNRSGLKTTTIFHPMFFEASC
jgi:hypothetical protein